MKYTWYIAIILLSIISCRKDDANQTSELKGYSKLKKIEETVQYRGRLYGRVREITIDSVNKRTIIKTYSNTPGDTIKAIYSYNDRNQLIQYEAASLLSRNSFITRMDFVRNAKGQLDRVLTEYNNSGIIVKSEGTCQYTNKGDTTFITFIDTANKRWSDEKDWYRVGLKKDRIVYQANLSIEQSGGVFVTEIRFIYDAAGNVIRKLYSYNGGSGFSEELKRGTLSPTQIKKFFNQLNGDIFWFQRQPVYEFMNCLTTIGHDYYLMGNVLESRGLMLYENEFDSFGNLKKIYFDDGSALNTQLFEYWP